MESLTPRPELENSLGGAASLVMGRGDGSNGCYSERPNYPERPIEWLIADWTSACSRNCCSRQGLKRRWLVVWPPKRSTVRLSLRRSLRRENSNSGSEQAAVG